MLGWGKKIANKRMHTKLLLDGEEHMLKSKSNSKSKKRHTCEGIIVAGAHKLQQRMDNATAGLHGQLRYCWVRCQSGQSSC